jgi:hypothetical protein
MPVPNSYLCPITHEIMTDPVICVDGHTYERAAISRWMQEHTGSACSSPMTGVPLRMNIGDLVPNYALRSLIQDYQESSMADLQFPATLSLKTVDAAELTVKTIRHEKTVHIEVTAPDSDVRAPCDLVFVVDVSGSMNAAAGIQGTDGQVQEYGLSVLDVVKHAAKTVMGLLNSNDRLALVAYDSDVVEVFAFTKMNKTGTMECIHQLDALQPGSCTNFWGGVEKGLELLVEHRVVGRNASMLVFTDGNPNIRPARPESFLIDEFNDRHNADFNINFFGFGYNMDSQLLDQCSLVGSGAYGFIPDGSFVGTIFVNAAANVLATCATKLSITLSSQGGSKIAGVLGNYRGGGDDQSRKVDLGSVMYGQTRNLVVEMDTMVGNDPDSSLVIDLNYFSFGNEKHLKVERLESQTTSDQVQKLNKQQVRYALIDGVAESLKSQPVNQDGAEQVRALHTRLQSASDESHKPFLDDLGGQVLEAFQGPGYFTRWGKHYLPSLIRAHQLEQRNNFKDPGVQGYGCSLFKELADSADKFFNDLPPPTPSLQTYNTVPIQSMSGFNSASGPCFAGGCEVALEDGSMCALQDLHRGAMVSTPNGHARVVCVVKTRCFDSHAFLVKLPNGLMVTPWHPIMVDSTWTFPNDVACPEIVTGVDAVYSLVIEHTHIVEINGYPTICLGHGYDDNDVLDHPYYGTERVIDDLRQMQGWGDGLVELSPGCARKDPQTGLVCQLVQ